MTVLLVLFTFITFLLIDHFMSRGNPPIFMSTNPKTIIENTLTVASGFLLPDRFRYHPGHTWALSESPILTRVGMNDFAAKLIGKIDSITLPVRGRWVRQGQSIFKITRDGQTISMLSPIEGSISDVNQAVVDNPELAITDPYGEGWLITVSAPDQKQNFCNLFTGALARIWMEETAHRFQPAGFTFDGGIAMNDFAAGENWEKTTKEFFLTTDS